MCTSQPSEQPLYTSATQIGSTSIKLYRPLAFPTYDDGAGEKGEPIQVGAKHELRAPLGKSIEPTTRANLKLEESTVLANSAWSAEEDRVLYDLIRDALEEKKKVTNYPSIEAALGEIGRGIAYKKPRNTIKLRIARFRAIYEVGLNPLSYVCRPWTPEEDAKISALKADLVRGGKFLIDWVAATGLFVGRPSFEVKERKEHLSREEKKRVAKEEKIKKVASDTLQQLEALNSTSLSPSTTLDQTIHSLRVAAQGTSLRSPVVTPPKLESITTAPNDPLPIPSSFFAQFASFSVPSPQSHTIPASVKSSSGSHSKELIYRNEEHEGSSSQSTGGHLHSRPCKSASASSVPSSRTPASRPSFLNVNYEYGYIPTSTSSRRKRSNLSPSNSLSPSKKRKSQLPSPSPTPTPDPNAPSSSSSSSSSSPRQGGIWISEEMAREGLKVLEKIKKSWDELDKEWDELVAKKA